MSLQLDSATKNQIVITLRNRGWRLVDPDANLDDWRAFLAQVAAYFVESHDADQLDSKRLNNAVIGAYCPYLHRGCVSQDPERQSQAYQEVWEWTYPRVFRRVGSAQDAEDVAQEVLTVVVAKIGRVTEPRGFLAFVNRIIHFQILSYYQSRNRRPTQLSLDEFDIELESSDSNTLFGEQQLEFEVDMAEVEIIALLEDCFPKKARKQLDVFVGRVLLNYSVLELSQALHTTPNSIHGRYHLARQRLLTLCPDVIARIIQHVRPSDRSSMTGVKS